MLKVLLCTISIAFYTSCSVLGKSAELTSVGLIELDVSYDASIEMFSNDNGEIFINFKANYDYDVDENYNLQITIFILEDGNWKYFYDIDGIWCETITKFDHPWDIVKKIIQPSLPDGCVIPEGEHVVENYRLTQADIFGYLVPANPGNYKAEVYVYVIENDEREDLLGITATFDVKE